MSAVTTGPLARTRLIRFVSIIAAALALSAVFFSASAGAVPAPPSQDPFYSYTGSTPLAQIAPGTPLKTRTVQWFIAGLPNTVTVVQILYRSTSTLGTPVVNVTSVLEPPVASSHPEIVAYQSFYDSLNPSDEPSYQIEGGITEGGGLADAESLLFAPELLDGNAVVVADTEGEQADFAAGPEYGMLTLDSLKAAIKDPTAALSAKSKIALLGYSGGAIATDWAAELAPTYAPSVNARLVGASMGGVLADPLHNLYYISGSVLWSGVMPMALIGLARAYGISWTPYLSSYGQQIFAKQANASIVNALGAYPGLTFAQLVKPQYANPLSIPPLVSTANKLIMGSAGTPTVPLLIDQGADGWLDGTDNDQAGIGAGDGVMIAGDVRSLAREYCARGVTVYYKQWNSLDHVGGVIPWILSSVSWMAGQFLGHKAPNDCSTIAAGNSLAPVTGVAPAS